MSVIVTVATREASPAPAAATGRAAIAGGPFHVWSFVMRKQAVLVFSQVAELGMFFAAAAALAVGLLGLR